MNEDDQAAMTLGLLFFFVTGCALILFLTGCAGLPGVQLNVQVGIVNVNEYLPDSTTDLPYKANMPWVESGGDTELDSNLTNEGMENSVDGSAI